MLGCLFAHPCWRPPHAGRHRTTGVGASAPQPLWHKVLLPGADTSASCSCRPCYGVGNFCKPGWGDGVTCACLLHGMCGVPLSPWLLVDMKPQQVRDSFWFSPVLFQVCHLGCGCCVPLKTCSHWVGECATSAALEQAVSEPGGTPSTEISQLQRAETS